MLGEIVLSGSSTDKTALYAWDIRSGSILTSLRASTCSPNSVTAVSFDSSLQSALVIAAQAEAPLINIFSWSKEQSVGKYIVPEKMQALQASPDGVYLVGGGHSGRIYLWNVITYLLIH